MKTITESQIREIKKLVGYKGRKVKLKEYYSGMSLNSYWESGCRNYYYWIAAPRPTDNPKLYSQIPQNGTPFDGLDLKTTGEEDLNNLILVERLVILGKEAGVNIYSK